MSYLIYTSASASTGLIPQPGRAVNTFPSGLVRVDQTYLGLTANAATHRAILAVGNDMPDGDTSPCVDDLKIFPEAQERRREDGFTEYIVSAYGRSKSTASFEPGIKNYSYGNFSINRGTATARIVSNTTPDFDSLNFPLNTFDPISAFYFGGTEEDFQANSISKISSSMRSSLWRFNFGTLIMDYLILNPGFTPATANSSIRLIELKLTTSQTNFGYWSEWIFSYG
jgi:hypothetical protein